jgi:hypothetical protein
VSLSGGEWLCTLGRRNYLCQWVWRSAARTRHRVPRDRCALRLLSSKQQVLAHCWYPWLWAWASHLAFSARRGDRPSVRQQWCPPWRPSPLWGTWTRGEFRGTPSRPSLLYPPDRPLFYWGAVPRNAPLQSPLNRSPGHYLGVRRRANLSVAEFPVARRGLFARGNGGLNHWVLGGASICRCRQRHWPGSGQWPGRLVAGSMEPPESDESDTLALRLPSVARGGFLRPKSPHGTAGLAPTGLASGSFARPFSRGGSLCFSPLLLFPFATWESSCHVDKEPTYMRAVVTHTKRENNIVGLHFLV